jgi:hypothetical protein
MSPRFEDKQSSQHGTRHISVEDREEGLDERDPGLTTADVASAGEKTLRAPAESRVAPEPRGPVPVQHDQESAPLFSGEENSDFRSRWDTIQVGFVDEPHRAVEEADKLVASAIQRLAQIFADERTKLEGQFKRGDNVSTEDLRVALQQYRSFFSRLLSV